MFAVVVLVQNAAEEINVRLEKHIYFHFLECYNLVHLLALHEYFIVNKSSSYIHTGTRQCCALSGRAAVT